MFLIFVFFYSFSSPFILIIYALPSIQSVFTALAPAAFLALFSPVSFSVHSPIVSACIVFVLFVLYSFYSLILCSYFFSVLPLSYLLSLVCQVYLLLSFVSRVYFLFCLHSALYLPFFFSSYAPSSFVLSLLSFPFTSSICYIGISLYLSFILFTSVQILPTSSFPLLLPPLSLICHYPSSLLPFSTSYIFVLSLFFSHYSSFTSSSFVLLLHLFLLPSFTSSSSPHPISRLCSLLGSVLYFADRGEVGKQYRLNIPREADSPQPVKASWGKVQSLPNTLN